MDQFVADNSPTTREIVCGQILHENSLGTKITATSLRLGPANIFRAFEKLSQAEVLDELV